MTVYRLRVERLEESAAHTRALADRLAPGERVELVVTADDSRCKRFAIDADGARTVGSMPDGKAPR